MIEEISLTKIEISPLRFTLVEMTKYLFSVKQTKILIKIT